jgi:hypothetical protein
VRLTVRHVYDFGPDRDRIGADLADPDAWDDARDTAGPFQLPTTREEWERAAGRPELAARAADIAAVARELGVRAICSYGIGTAMLELGLSRRLPAVALTCTDYAPRAVERLRVLFPEAEVVRHDLRTGDPLPADLHLMHRVDSELSNDEWKAVLPRFREPILFVPAIVLTFSTVAREVGRRLMKPRATRAGWARNEAALRDLWRATHDDRRVSVGGGPAFLLTRRR